MANDFLPFAGAGGANVMTQADYLALASRLSGFTAGTAQSAQLNKVWRQSSLMTSMVGQFISNRSGQNAVDDGTTGTLLTNFELAVNGLGQVSGGSYALGGGTANAQTATYTPAVTVLTDGMVLKYKASIGNTGPATFSPNGMGAGAIIGSSYQALQGGEILAGGEVWLQYNSSGFWVLIKSAGGGAEASAADAAAGTNNTKWMSPLRVFQAIAAVVTQATETVFGWAKVATQAQTNAGSDDATIVTPKKLRFGFNILLAQNGYITFPSWMGGLTLQWSRATLATAGGYAWTYPTPFPNAVFNCWAGVYAPSAADVVNRTSQPVAPGLTACAFAVSANGAAIAASTSIWLVAVGY